MTPPKTMRAWTYQKSLKTLTQTPDHPTPTPRTNEVLIKVSHAAFTPSATSIIPLIPAPLRHSPSIPELEFSGRIVSLGANVSDSRPDLQIGTAVFGATSLGVNIWRGLGSLAEYVPCPVDGVGVLPSGLGFDEGVAVAANGFTALQVVDACFVKRGDKVFVNGGSGGMGTLIVQVLRERVGESGIVVSSCSGGNVELVRSLGADEVIDYRQHDPLHEYLEREHSQSRFDAIVDTVGIQELYTHSPAYLREGGRFVNIGAMKVQSGDSKWVASICAFLGNLLLPAWLGGTPRSYQMVTGTPNERDLGRVRKLVEDGSLRPVIDSVWGMDDVLQAYERLHSQRAKGKVVVKVENGDL